MAEVSVELMRLRKEYETEVTERVAMEGLLTHMCKGNPTAAVGMLTKAVSTITKQCDDLEEVKMDLKASIVTQGDAQIKMERMRTCYDHGIKDRTRRLGEVHHHASHLSDPAHPCIYILQMHDDLSELPTICLTCG